MIARIVIRTRAEFNGTALGLPFLGSGGFDSSRRRRILLGEHRHPGHEITYVFEGEVHWETAKGERLTLRGGDLAITQPGIAHWGYLQIIEPATFFWINVDLRKSPALLFTGTEHKRLYALFCSAGNTTRHGGELLATELKHLYRDVTALRSLPNSLTQAAVRARIATVLLLVARMLSSPIPRTSHDYVCAAQNFLRDHYSDPTLSTSAIADHVGISVSRLHTIFKECTGMTLNDYRQRVRIEAAQELLRTTKRPVSRIAMECGFSSGQYFATCFHKYTGTTPKQYRKHWSDKVYPLRNSGA